MGRERVREKATPLRSLVRAGAGFRVFDPDFVLEGDELVRWRGRYELDLAQNRER